MKVKSRNLRLFTEDGRGLDWGAVSNANPNSWARLTCHADQVAFCAYHSLELVKSFDSPKPMLEASTRCGGGFFLTVPDETSARAIAEKLGCELEIL